MSAKTKNFLIKYNYLLRFVITLCIALYIPGLIFGSTVIRRSYNEMLKRNEDYYREVTESFLVYFDEQINVFKNHALSIAVGNINSDNKIIKETIESHPYYYLSATKILSEYKIGLPASTDLGLYFKDTDYIITSGFKYKMDDFIKIYAGKSPEQVQQMLDFFNSNSNKTIMVSTFESKDYSDARLFIGIPVTMNNQYKALIFYMLKHDSISTSFFGTQSSEHLRLCLFNYDGSLLYTNKTSNLQLLNNENFIKFITDSNSSISEYSINKNNSTIFKINNANLEKIFVSIVPQDQVERNLRQFYSVLKNNAIIIAIGFVILLIFTVYINYQPISKLVRSVMSKYEDIGINSEIKTISRAFDQITNAYDQMEEYVSEQQIMLMDYLLGNLLYGISIPQADAERLDINLQDGSFCVLTISDLKLDTKGREQLAEHILTKCNTHTYITDILYKNHIVLICVLKDSDIEGLVREVRQYLFAQYEISYKIGAGHIVHKLDDIRKSYMNALHVMESTTIDINTLNLEISIVDNYPSEDILIFLNYVKNGETDNALKTLDSIVQFISNKIDTVLMQRYICYDILIAYIKCLEQIKYPLEKKETLDLLAHNNISELYEALSTSVKLVCSSIAHNKDNMYNSLQKNIIDYINENFTDPNISRTQVADEFGISIYSLSRLFKDNIGIGFKEYISAKRMELSRQLLLTTDRTITEITSEVGFDDPNYFSKLFKANYGSSPSQYRNQQ